jgi:hypothetical protein
VRSATRLNSRNRMLDRISGVMIGLGVIGSAIYALGAVAVGLPPADWFCALKALYAFGGSYNLVEA